MCIARKVPRPNGVCSECSFEIGNLCHCGRTSVPESCNGDAVFKALAPIQIVLLTLDCRREVVTVSSDGHVRVFDARTSENLHTYAPPTPAHLNSALQLSVRWTGDSCEGRGRPVYRFVSGGFVTYF